MFLHCIVLILTFLQSVTWAVSAGAAPDPGWRWRQSLNIDVKRDGATVLHVNADNIHEELYQYEIKHTPSVVFSSNPPNTLTAAITLLIQTPSGLVPHTNIISDLKTGKPFLFCSNAATQFFDSHSTHIAKTKRNPSPSWFNPKGFYPSGGDLQPFLEALGLTFGSARNPAAPAYSDQNFNHTETKLLYYLLNEEGLNDQIEQALQAIFQVEDVAHLYPNIRGIILHIHTRYDPCTRCADSLTGFKKHAHTWLTPLDINCPVMVTVSSRTAYDHARDMHGFNEYSYPPIPHRILVSEAGDAGGGSSAASSAAGAAASGSSAVAFSPITYATPFYINESSHASVSGGAAAAASGGAAVGSGSGTAGALSSFPSFNIHSIKPDVAQPYHFLR